MRRIFSISTLVLCFTIVILILFSLFCLPFSDVSKHHNLLLSTYEYITVAKSSRVTVFFMFNVIVLTILLVSLSPSTRDFDLLVHEIFDGKEIHGAISFELHSDDTHDKDEDDDNEYDHGYDGYEEDNDDDGSSDDDIDSDEEQDYDLKKRIDEFIAEVNMKRREELIQEQNALYLTAS
ncbi:hypothetical protein O6P43_017479 [Quillaja saponaria]|uniref:Transmembrane protein n=1 Tax=Quillaja saponaria TaxID=32244 RepID=A0AAD7PPE8_QUISA|nr:hypothetical protein O6P43_017479 [Quillaja saponaria]